MLPGTCCIAIATLGANERRKLTPHVRFQVPFLELESQLKSGFACAGLLCQAVPFGTVFWFISVKSFASGRYNFRLQLAQRDGFKTSLEASRFENYSKTKGLWIKQSWR